MAVREVVAMLGNSKRTARSKIQLLQRVPAFAGCTERELESIARHVDDWTVEPGANLTREGSPGHEAFVIIEGHATVRVHGEVIATLGPGEIVGELSMLDHQPRSATVEADTAMRLFVIGPDSFDEFASLRPVARQLNKELADRLRKADEALSAADATG